MRRKRASWLLVPPMLLAGLGVMSGGAARGQSTEGDLGISPAIGALDTTPARTVEETVEIVNLSDHPLQIGISLEDLEVDARGRFKAVAAEARPTSAVGWGFVEPQGLRLPAGNTRGIKVALTPPEGTAPGEYTAALRFSVSSHDGTSEYVHPVLLGVNTQGLVRSAKVAGLFVPSRSFGSTMPVTLAVENSGPVHVVAQGTLIVSDATSRVTARVPIPRTIVVPGQTRILAVDVPSPLIPWRARVRADVGFGPGVPRDSMTTSGYAFSWFGVAVVAAVLLLIAWTIAHFVRRRVARRRTPVEAPMMVMPSEPAVRQTMVAPPAAVSDEPAVRRAPLPVAVPQMDRESASQPVVTQDDLVELWGPVVPKEKPAAAPSGAVMRWTADEIARELADMSSPEPAADDAEPDDAEPEREEVRVIVLPGAVEPEESVSLGAASEEKEVVRVIRLDPKSEEAPAPVLEPVAAETFPEAVSTPSKLPSIAAATGSEGPAARPRLKVLPRESVVEEPDAPLTPAAVDRRARVALDMLHDGPGRTGARVEVALDVLHTVKANLIVNSKVEEAYEAARKARDRQALAPLALALAAVGSPAAPAALLRAYATAPDALADSLLGAIRKLTADELKDNRRLVTALPPERRAAVRGR